MSETEDKIQPDVFQLSFNARTLVNATVDFLNSAGEKVGKILVSVDNMLQNFGNESIKNVGNITGNVEEFTRGLNNLHNYQLIFMLLFAILLMILVIVLIVFVCCLLFRTRTEYKKQPFRKKKKRHAATLTHAETPRAFSPIPAAPTHYPTFSPYNSATTFDSSGPIFSTTVTTLAPTPRIHGIATISPPTGTTFAPTTSVPTTKPLSSKSAPEMRTKPTTALFTPVTTNGPTTNQPIFTTASIVTLAPSQPVSTTAPNPVPTKRKFGVPTPFTEADTYPLQRSKGIQKNPPLTLNRETQKTPVEVENRETQWTPDSSVKGGNGSGSRKSSGSSQDSSHPIRIPIERLERSEIFV